MFLNSLFSDDIFQIREMLDAHQRTLEQQDIVVGDEKPYLVTSDPEPSVSEVISINCFTHCFYSHKYLGMPL